MKQAHQSKKTDNKHFFSKIALREYFLKKYHSDQKFRVLDCCAGSGKIWGHLGRSFSFAYVGVDLKRESGRLTTNSENILSRAGWRYDVIDIDTYGSPLVHYLNIMKTIEQENITIFLTIGKLKQRANIPNAAKHAAGIDFKIPPGLQFFIHDYILNYCVASCYNHGIIIKEAKEAFPQTNARYVGLRLERGENVRRYL